MLWRDLGAPLKSCRYPQRENYLPGNDSARVQDASLGRPRHRRVERWGLYFPSNRSNLSLILPPFSQDYYLSGGVSLSVLVDGVSCLCRFLIPIFFIVVLA